MGINLLPDDLSDRALRRYASQSAHRAKMGSWYPEMAASHFLQVQVKSQVISLQVQVKSQVISLQVQVKSQVIWSDVKSSHKSFGPNTSQVTSLFVQVQVKSHIILSSCNTQSGPVIKSIYSELRSKIYEMVNGIK